MANSTHPYTHRQHQHIHAHPYKRTLGTHVHTHYHVSKHLHKVLSKQGSMGKVDKEAPERYEVIVKQFKRRAVTERGNNINKPRKFSGFFCML